MNCSVTLDQSMRVSRERRQQFIHYWEESHKDRAASGPLDVFEDKIPISLCNISHAYGDKGIFDTTPQTLTQGKFYMVLGERHSGKATFLRLLSLDLMPS